jgi:hypothetical protein
MPNQKDMLLSVSCKFTGAWQDAGPGNGNRAGYYGTMTYTQLPNACDPVTMPAIVDHATGAISVYLIGDVNGYNTGKLDMEFSLDPSSSCTLQNGTVVGVTWATNMSNDPAKLPAMLLLDGPPSPPPPALPTNLLSPSKADASWKSNSNKTVIKVNDKDESANYYFRPAVVVPDAGDYYISCDPPLLNRRG